MDNENSKQILAIGKAHNFLLDTSTILYFETLHKHTGASIFKVFSEIPTVQYFVVNDVLSELITGKNANPKYIFELGSHVLNSEIAMLPGHKENRFLIKDDSGKTGFIKLNKVSVTDYSLILMCQNHHELTLVANDRKLIKNGARVIDGRRVLGIPAFLDKLLEIDPGNTRIIALKDKAGEIFILKHAFDRGKKVNK